MNVDFQRRKMHGLAATDALVKDLSDRGIHYAVKVDDDNRVLHLFIAYPESIKLALRNQDVVLADCTYSTNQFNVPLLHIVGMQSLLILLSVIFGLFSNPYLSEYVRKYLIAMYLLINKAILIIV